MFYTIHLKLIRLFLSCFLFVLAAAAAVLLISERQELALAVPAVSERGGVPTLILDPGHGGEDGGAVSPNGLVESLVNWEIVRRLEALADFFGLDSVKTRESEAIEYPDAARTTASRKGWDTRSRVELVNSVPDAVLISVHQNKYPTAGPCGALVLYGAGEESKALAELTHANLLQGLDPTNRRVAAPVPRGVYMFKNIGCTAILAECGFLSNPREEALLLTDTYRLKVAVLLMGSCLQYYGTVWGDTNEI